MEQWVSCLTKNGCLVRLLSLSTTRSSPPPPGRIVVEWYGKPTGCKRYMIATCNTADPAVIEKICREINFLTEFITQKELYIFIDTRCMDACFYFQLPTFRYYIHLLGTWTPRSTNRIHFHQTLDSNTVVGRGVLMLRRQYKAPKR